jgi:hypothetical protein
MARKDDDDDRQEETSDGSVAVNDAWTGMLAISLLALIIASTFLAWDWFQMSDKEPQIISITKSAPPPAPGK